jgi:hypothetical protein
MHAPRPLERMLSPEDGWRLVSFVASPRLPAAASPSDPIEVGPLLGRGSFGTVRPTAAPPRGAPAGRGGRPLTARPGPGGHRRRWAPT